MSKVVVLGGCGAVGSVAVRTLAQRPEFSRIVIGDQNAERARELVQSLGAGRVSFVATDAGDAASVRRAIDGADIVLNCVGPFYKTVKTILAAVIDAAIDYVDICDDVDVTLDVLEMNDAARRAGITALIGMGASPGATNLLGKYIADSQMDETDSIDIFHCHGGEPTEGPGVIGHRFHCMSIDIPMFLEGRLKTVRYFGEDGIALRQTFDFPVLGPTPTYPYPHPEQVTMPQHLRVRQVTNRGSVLPLEYYHLTGELCRLGLTSKEPIEVSGHDVVPYDFSIAFLLQQRERILKETNFGKQRGCMSVVVKGRKNGEAREVRVHMGSDESALGEGTGIPAAIGVMLMQRGSITAKGVLPPEACLDPMEFIGLATEVMAGAPRASDGKRPPLLIFETIAADGSMTRMEL